MAESLYHGFPIVILGLKSIMYGLYLGEPTYGNCFFADVDVAIIREGGVNDIALIVCSNKEFDALLL
jgi:hypothetical protein